MPGRLEMIKDPAERRFVARAQLCVVLAYAGLLVGVAPLAVERSHVDRIDNRAPTATTATEREHESADRRSEPAAAFVDARDPLQRFLDEYRELPDAPAYALRAQRAAMASPVAVSATAPVPPPASTFTSARRP